MMYNLTHNPKVNPSVLVDEIIKISNWIHRDTKRGGANMIRVNSKTYWKYIVPNLERVYPRFSIESDNKTKENSVFVIFSDVPKFSGEIKIESQ